jgi:N utilization substance protein A
MTITFNTETIRLLTLFENVTNVPVRDCFVTDDVIYYIVEEGKIGLAIGKNGNSIKNVERVVGKRVKVFEYSTDLETFVRNLIPQSKEVKIVDNGSDLTVEIKVNRRDRGFVIGRGGERIKVYKEVLKRIYNISNIEVK